MATGIEGNAISAAAGLRQAATQSRTQLEHVARELMALVGCGRDASGAVASALDGLGSGPEHRSARKAAAAIVCSTWLPFIPDMPVEELKQKLAWLGETASGERRVLAQHLRWICEQRPGNALARRPNAWNPY